jgi:hypothetical protein
MMWRLQIRIIVSFIVRDRQELPFACREMETIGIFDLIQKITLPDC